MLLSEVMTGGAKGMIVGFANTVVVAFCIAAMQGKGGAELFVLVAMLAAVPATLTGGLLGYIAASAKRVHRGIVLGMLILISCMAVAMLGSTFDVEELIWVSCIPTAAACSILERWTRPAPEPLPIARAS